MTGLPPVRRTGRPGAGARGAQHRLDITERIRPPRAAFLNVPLGNATGRPHDAEGQRQVLRRVLGLAETAREPGAIAELPDRWPDADWEAQTIRGSMPCMRLSPGNSRTRKRLPCRRTARPDSKICS